MWLWRCVIAVLAWGGAIALAAEYPERMAEAQALIGRAEHTLTTRPTSADRAALQTQARTGERLSG